MPPQALIYSVASSSIDSSQNGHHENCRDLDDLLYIFKVNVWNMHTQADPN